jgi:hypothetical protein
MKQICLAAVSGAALLALASFAYAQKSGIGAPPLTGSGSSGAAANQCWDVTANIVRDKSTAAGATSGSTADRTGTTGAAGSAGSASGSPPGAAAAARPAGMPNC